MKHDGLFIAGLGLPEMPMMWHHYHHYREQKRKDQKLMEIRGWRAQMPQQEGCTMAEILILRTPVSYTHLRAHETEADL
eukprot:2361280-Amphidinium_carterae.1